MSEKRKRYAVSAAVMCPQLVAALQRAIDKSGGALPGRQIYTHTAPDAGTSSGEALLPELLLADLRAAALRWLDHNEFAANAVLVWVPVPSNRTDRTDQIAELLRAGHSAAAIRAALRCSDHRVRVVAHAIGVKPARTAVSEDERDMFAGLVALRHAKRLQIGDFARGVGISSVALRNAELTGALSPVYLDRYVDQIGARLGKTDRQTRKLASAVGAVLRTALEIEPLGDPNAEDDEPAAL
ncbi:MAG: hypothetical protein WC700_14945 [Gemmatimonadaceae bacterium]|jgi:hypothetical protein